MSQSVVTIRLNGTPYQIGCGEGEEAHIEKLGAEIDTVLQQLAGSVGQIGESRLLAMAALIFADRAHEAGDGAAANGSAQTATAPASDRDTPDADATADTMAETMERVAERIGTLASRLASH